MFGARAGGFDTAQCHSDIKTNHVVIPESSEKISGIFLRTELKRYFLRHANGVAPTPANQQYDLIVHQLLSFLAVKLFQ